jgi:tricarballylate dehydrogenase
VVDGYDVAVVGAGNAAFSAALAARERVERVLVLEKAPREWVGGNSYLFYGGRLSHDLREFGGVASPPRRGERGRVGQDRSST